MNTIKIFLIVSIIFNLSISIELCIDVVHPTHVPISDWWGILIDSLESWGATIHFPDTSYEWGPDYISCCDKIWIIGEGCHAYEELQKISLINHVKSGKPLSVYATTIFSFPGCTVNTITDLLEYDKWNTTVKILYQIATPPCYVTKDFLNHLLLNEIDSLTFSSTEAYVQCGDNCYPLVFGSDYYHYKFVYVAIIYPFLNDTNCSYITTLYGFHTWEDWVFSSGFWNYDNFKLTKNILLAPNNFDFPCPVPEPYQISVTSIPPCANPGDTVRLNGRNLWRGKTESLGGDIEIYIGATEPVPHEYDTIVIPIRYSQNYTGDSTWLEFIMPDLPPGTYPIRLGHKAITFDAGDIVVPCPMVAEIPECANPGDTVVVSGVNLLPDIVIQIDDTTIEPINYALGYDTLEFVCPSLPSGAHQISFFWDTLEIFSGSILIPCPTASASFPECADPGDFVTISGENLVEPISITVGDSVVSTVSYSDDRSKVAFLCPWLPRGQYLVNLSWHDMFVASGTIEIPCPHRCERFPNPITPNFDAINDFAQFEFDGIFVKPAQIHIFDIHGHRIRTINVPAGLSAKQHARWNGTDDGGNPVPEGVYIYTIEVASEIVCEGTVTVAR